jgi:hypothetical protein
MIYYNILHYSQKAAPALVLECYECYHTNFFEIYTRADLG